MLALAMGAQSTLDVMPMAAAGAGAGAAPAPIKKPSVKVAVAAPAPAPAAPAAPKVVKAAVAAAAAKPKLATLPTLPILKAAPIVPVEIAGEQVTLPDMMEVIVTDESDPRSALYRDNKTLEQYTKRTYEGVDLDTPTELNEAEAAGEELTAAQKIEQTRRDRMRKRKSMHEYVVQKETEEHKGKYLTSPDAYVPSTRKSFYSFIQNTYAELFSAALDARSRTLDPAACEKLLKGGTERVVPFLYQRFVKEYTRMASPYRGLLVYHGLGSGKTCSAIAAAEALYGVANRRIIVMTPKSLRGNFINEIKFCGFRHFSTNNHWIRLDLNIDYSATHPNGKVSAINELYARSVVGLDMEYIQALRDDFIVRGRRPIYRPSVWIPDFDKPSNWATLPEEEKDFIQRQIDYTINKRIEFINYNGVSAAILKQWACEGGHFDNAVIVIDEIHNLVRLMQETIEPFLFRRGGRARKIDIEPVTPRRWKPALCGADLNYKRGFLFYRLLCDARGSKIVGLSGTPIINFPEELGILTNLLTGYIDCFRLRINTTVPSQVERAMDIVRKERRVDVVRGTQGVAYTEMLVSMFTDGYIKADRRGAGAAAGAGAGAGAGATTPDDVILDMDPAGPGMERIEIVAKRAQAALKAAGFDVGDPVLQSFSRLPPDAETFRSTFIDLSRYGLNLSTVDILRKRLTGVISYYRGSKADFVPTITKDELIECDMSPYVFEKYCEQRKLEIDQEVKKKPEEKGASLYAIVEMNAKAKNPSSYKFRSRAICNFAFPKGITRPYPSDVEKEAVVEAEADLIDEDAVVGEADTNPDLDRAAEMAVEEEEAAIDAALEEVALAGGAGAGAGAGAPKPAPKPAVAAGGAGAGAGAPLAVKRVPPKISGGGSSNSNEEGRVEELVDEEEEEEGEGEEGGNGDSVKSVKPKPLNESSSDEGSVAESIVAAAAAAIGAQGFIAKSYKVLLEEAMAKLDANRNRFLTLDGATAAGSLRTYSPKMDHILRKLAESAGPNLVYSQFKTVEGLGVLGIALKANGYEEIVIRENMRKEIFMTEASIASLQKGPGIPRFITFSGDGSRELKVCVLQIFNGQLHKLPPSLLSIFQGAKDAEGNPLYDVTGKPVYLHGEICKVIGITGAGAEGISLRNVRQVHILEPYWNMVRIEQVKGRAVRICSHMDLPMEERNVEIYSYVMRFSNEQRTGVGETGIPSMIRTNDVEIRNEGGRKVQYIYTSDENVLFVALRKEQITQDLSKVMKEVAVDCQMNAPDNEPDDLTCFVVAPPPETSKDRKMFDPDLEVDLAETGMVFAKKGPGKAGAAGGAGAGAGGTAAPTGAGAALAAATAAAKKEEGVAVQYLTVVQKSTKEAIRYIVGKPDKDGFAFLYGERDTTFRTPLAKVQVTESNAGAKYSFVKM